jgi:hypothetical protein
VAKQNRLCQGEGPTDAEKGCERRLKRKAFIGAQADGMASHPVSNYCLNLLTTQALSYPRRRWLKAKLKDRNSGAGSPSEHQVVGRWPWSARALLLFYLQTIAGEKASLPR